MPRRTRHVAGIGGDRGCARISRLATLKGDFELFIPSSGYQLVATAPWVESYIVCKPGTTCLPTSELDPWGSPTLCAPAPRR